LEIKKENKKLSKLDDKINIEEITKNRFQNKDPQELADQKINIEVRKGVNKISKEDKNSPLFTNLLLNQDNSMIAPNYSQNSKEVKQKYSWFKKFLTNRKN